MSNQVNDMLAVLPPFEGERVMIWPDEQSVYQIIQEVTAAHKEFAPDYDNLVGFFSSSDLLHELFLFCQNNLPYIAETEKLQTSRSPTAILSLKDYWGVDCKHYAGWIAGVIDAYNRAGYTDYDWCYRFVSYNVLSPEKDHVFVVVRDSDREIWLDPAPIENTEGGYTGRYYDDRLVIPFYFTDKKPKPMIQRIRGVSAVPPQKLTAYQEDYAIYRNELPRPQPFGRQEEVLMDLYNQDFTQPQPNMAEIPGTPAPYDQVNQPAQPYYDYGKIEQVDELYIADYPTVTGEPIQTLPMQNQQTELQQTDIKKTAITTTFKGGFNVMDFIKTNPVETALIAGVVLVGGYFLIAGRKKKRKK